MTFSNKYNFDAGLRDLFTGYLKKQKMFSSKFPKATVTGPTVAVLYSGYITQRRHNTPAVDLVTVALGNVTENIFCFFKYPVNKFEIRKYPLKTL